MNKSIDEIDFEKSGGLVPVIVQDANTKDVLTTCLYKQGIFRIGKKNWQFLVLESFQNKLWMKVKSLVILRKLRNTS